jgi:D-alanyl-lipoteichoic acid acyltransferase DltB (MBOAT superfamily)
VLALPVLTVYADLTSSPPLELLVASIFGVYRVYADWLGYSLIAIGSARLLGIDFADNFRQPFLSPTLAEFWRRWNISLLNWFRDYVFMPMRLALRKYPRLSAPVATVVAFTLLGIWHAAGWGYLLYGAGNGILVAVSQWTLAGRDRFWRSVKCPAAVITIVRIPVTFMIVVLFYPLAATDNLHDAFYVYASVFSPTTVFDLWQAATGGVASRLEVFPHIRSGIGPLLIAVLVLGDIVMLLKPAWLMRPLIAMRAVICAICLVAVAVYAASSSQPRPFVYFQY